jgi:hypothetical protein
MACHLTRGLAGLRAKGYDGEDLVWGCAATAWATSLAHIDDDGLATAICVMAGSKYWVVMRSKTSEVVENGNLRSTRAFPQNFYKNSGKGLWEAEGIHLVQGDVL